MPPLWLLQTLLTNSVGFVFPLHLRFTKGLPPWDPRSPALTPTSSHGGKILIMLSQLAKSLALASASILMAPVYPPNLVPFAMLLCLFFPPPPSPPFLLAPNGTYFACASGLTPHIVVNLFYTTNDYCVLILLLPRLTVHRTEDLLAARDIGPTHHRSKREPITAITVGVLLSLGAAGAGTGIASLVETREQYSHLAVLQ